MNQTERIIGSEILRKLPYEPNSQQMEIIAALSKFVADTDDRSVFLLNGYAGTGKTSLAGALVAALPALRRQAVLLAPTGRAAKVFAAYSRHSAFTIHRKIYQSRRYNPEDSHFCLARNNHNDTPAASRVRGGDRAGVVSSKIPAESANGRRQRPACCVPGVRGAGGKYGTLT